MVYIYFFIVIILQKKKKNAMSLYVGRATGIDDLATDISQRWIWLFQIRKIPTNIPVLPWKVGHNFHTETGPKPEYWLIASSLNKRGIPQKNIHRK